MPTKYQAYIKQVELGRQNPMILKQKRTEIFQMDDVFNKAFGSSSNSWRSTLHRVREEFDIDLTCRFF